jgi:hypothetical protein
MPPYHRFMRISRSVTGVTVVLVAYSVALWQYLAFALYQKFGLVTIGVVFLLATIVVASVARVILGSDKAAEGWANLAVAACIVAAAALYFGAFEYSACYFPDAARCTVQLP